MGDDAAPVFVASAEGEDQHLLHGVVEQKLGRCLIRLQQYELLMKDFVARARVEGPADSIAEQQTARAAAIAQQTLGQVVGGFVGTVFSEPDWDPDGFPPAASSTDEGARVASGFSMTFSDETLAATKAAMAELVGLRNALVHEFIAKHDLQSEAGCVAAAAYLNDAHAVIDGHFQEASHWYNAMIDLSRAVAEAIANPENHDHLYPDVVPEDVGVGGSASTIVQLLRRAEGELSLEGWTPLDDAIALIRKLASEHTPGRYGCSTWRQVLHESRPTFAVRRDAADPLKPGRTWYRSASPRGNRADIRE